MTPLLCVVGLGNPGKKYANTRHNVGFMTVNSIAGQNRIKFRKRLTYHFAELIINKNPPRVVPTRVSPFVKGGIKGEFTGGTRVILVKPQTFMNNSGSIVLKARKKYSLSPSHFLIIYDDIDLPLGKIRIKKNGSSGGHKGMQSIIDALGTNEIPRIRIGIGRIDQNTRDYVLSEFMPEEKETIENALAECVSAVEEIVTTGTDKAMNKYN